MAKLLFRHKCSRLGRIYCKATEFIPRLPVSRGNVTVDPLDSLKASELEEIFARLDKVKFGRNDGSLDSYECFANKLTQTRPNNAPNILKPVIVPRLRYKLNIYLQQICVEPSTKPTLSNNDDYYGTLEFRTRTELLQFKRKLTKGSTGHVHSFFETAKEVQYTTRLLGNEKQLEHARYIINRKQETACPGITYEDERTQRAYKLAESFKQAGVRLKFAILDTGATCNLWKHRKDLKDIDWNERPSIKGIGGTRSALGVGNLGNFGRTLLTPEAPLNILSVSQLSKRQKRTIFYENQKGATVHNPDGSVYLRAHYRYGLWFAVFPEVVHNNTQPAEIDLADIYAISAIQEEIIAAGSGSAILENKAVLLHKALGHPSWLRLWHAYKNGLIKLDYEIKETDFRKLPSLCDACAQAKLTSKAKPKVSKKRSTKPFQQLHIDIAECNASLAGYKYAAIIVDDYTNYNWVLPLKQKSDIVFKVYTLIRRICTGADEESKIFLPSEYISPDNGPNFIRTDGAGELCGDAFSRMCASWGTHKLTTVPYSSHQNGRAEKAIRDLFTKARAMTIDANLPQKYWWYALQAACHAKNRTPSVRRWHYNKETDELSKYEPKTPFFMMTGRHPDCSYMVPFGTRCFVKRKPPKTRRKSKTAPVADECRCLGYAPGTKGYLYQPIKEKNSNKLVGISKDIIFDMRSFGHCKVAGSLNLKQIKQKTDQLKSQPKITDYFKQGKHSQPLDDSISGAPGESNDRQESNTQEAVREQKEKLPKECLTKEKEHFSDNLPKRPRRKKFTFNPDLRPSKGCSRCRYGKKGCPRCIARQEKWDDMFDPDHKKLHQQTQDLNGDSDDPFRRSDQSDDSTDPLTRHIHKPQVLSRRVTRSQARPIAATAYNPQHYVTKNFTKSIPTLGCKICGDSTNGCPTCRASIELWERTEGKYIMAPRTNLLTNTQRKRSRPNKYTFITGEEDEPGTDIFYTLGIDGPECMAQPVYPYDFHDECTDDCPSVSSHTALSEQGGLTCEDDINSDIPKPTHTEHDASWRGEPFTATDYCTINITISAIDPQGTAHQHILSGMRFRDRDFQPFYDWAKEHTTTFDVSFADEKDIAALTAIFHIEKF